MAEAGLPETLPRIGARGIAALRGTRGWARLVGVMAIVGAAIAIINVVTYFSLPHEIPLYAHRYAAAIGRLFAIAGAIWAVIVYGLAAWFALRYARDLGPGLVRADGSGLEAALNWQRRYWTLQGVLTIIFIIVVVLGTIAAIGIAVTMAAHHMPA